VTLNKGRGQHSKYLPYAFTEQGVAMLSSVLKSEKAIEVNIAIMRTFVLIRQYAMNYKDLQEKIEKLEVTYKKDYKEIYQAINLLLKGSMQKKDFSSRERIGFKTKSAK
jgi:hypothetical protein